MEFVTMFHNLQLSDSYVFHNVNYDFVVIIVYNFKHWGENIWLFKHFIQVLLKAIGFVGLLICVDGMFTRFTNYNADCLGLIMTNHLD
jgi:hypothetical protein